MNGRPRSVVFAPSTAILRLPRKYPCSNSTTWRPSSRSNSQRWRDTSVPRGPEVGLQRQKGRSELENDVLVVAQDDRFRRTRVRLLIHGRLDRFAIADAIAVDRRLTQWLPPHRKKIAERERASVARLDMDDPARVVRVEPTDLASGDADERGHRFDLTADHDGEVRVL